MNEVWQLSCCLSFVGQGFRSNYCPETVTAGKIMGLILKEDAKPRVWRVTELQ